MCQSSNPSQQQIDLSMLSRTVGGYHHPVGDSKPVRGSPRGKMKALNCYCKCVFSPWVAWRSKSEGSRRLLSDKNTIFLEVLGGLGCLPQCCLSVAGGGAGVEAKGYELRLRVGGSGFPGSKGPEGGG